MSAFHNDLRIKAACLTALAAGPTPLTSPVVSQDDLFDWLDEFGLPRAFGLLASRLHRSGAPTDAATVDLLGAIPVGEDLESSARLWTLWGWRAAPTSLQSLVKSEAFRTAGEDLMALHARAAAGEVPGKAEWRAVRSRLGALAQADTLDGALASVIAAAAWDYGSTPGAISDFVAAWEGFLRSRIHAEEGWGDAERKGVLEIVTEHRLRVEAQIEPLPENAGADETSARKKRVTAELLAQLNASGHPHLLRNRDVNARTLEAFERFRATGQAELVRLIRAATDVV